MEREKLELIVSAAQRGEADAKAQLYQEYSEELYYYILKIVKNPEMAADLTQDAFIEILQTIHKLQEPKAFTTWSRQIAYHKCTAHFRKRRELLADENEDGFSVLDTVVEEREEFIPDEALDKDELKKTIQEMIDSLPEEQRAAVMMRYFDEISVKEIADIQGVSEGTVKSRLNYARKSIKQSVEDYEQKNGIKLHCKGIIPLLLWLFGEYRMANGMAFSPNAGYAAIKAIVETKVNVEKPEESIVKSGGEEAAKKVVKEAAKAGTKSITTKVVAGILAAAVAIGGVAAVTSNNKENKTTETVSNEEPATTADSMKELGELEEQLDYEYLEKVFWHLPLYDEENPITDTQFYNLMQDNIFHLYLTDGGANAPEDFPTVLSSEDIIENVVPDNGEVIGEWQMYIRVKGDSFDETAKMLGLDNFDAETLMNEFQDEYSRFEWNEGSIRYATDGIGGFFGGKEVQIKDAYMKDEKCYVEYTYTDNTMMGFEMPAQNRVAELEFTDSSYVIQSISMNEEPADNAGKTEVNLNDYVYSTEDDYFGYIVGVDYVRFHEDFAKNVNYEVKDKVIYFGDGEVKYDCGESFLEIDDTTVDSILMEGAYQFASCGIKFPGDDKIYYMGDGYMEGMNPGDKVEIIWNDEYVHILEQLFNVDVICEDFVFEIGAEN